MSIDQQSFRDNPKAFLSIGSGHVIWLLLFFLIPLGIIFIYSFSEKTGINSHEFNWNVEYYIKSFGSIYLEIFVKSILIAAGATVICLLIGYPIAMAISFAPAKYKLPLLVLLVLPFWINVLIRTYALIAIFRGNGYVNKIYEFFWSIGHDILSLFGLVDDKVVFTPLELLYSNVAVVLGVTYAFIPFMIMPIYASMEKLDRSYLEASLDLGASHFVTFIKIMFPLTASGVLSGIIIVFIPALGAFYIADLLGGANSELIGNVIYRQFIGANNWPFGSALSLILMLLTFSAILLRQLVVASTKT